MSGGVWFGLAVAAFGGLMFAASRIASTVSANIRIQLGQKLEKEAFVRRNVHIARIVGLAVVLVGIAIAILSQTVGRMS
jgi:hypothetical protein